jgi:hypothetical protein
MLLVDLRKLFIKPSLSKEAISNNLQAGKHRITLDELLWVNEFLKECGRCQIKIAQIIYSKGSLSPVLQGLDLPKERGAFEHYDSVQ